MNFNYTVQVYSNQAGVDQLMGQAELMRAACLSWMGREGNFRSDPLTRYPLALFPKPSAPVFSAPFQLMPNAVDEVELAR